jgi:hypothetical protein
LFKIWYNTGVVHKLVNIGNLKMTRKNYYSDHCIPNRLASLLAAREYLAPRPAEGVVVTVLEKTRCPITPYLKKQSQFVKPKST